MRRKRRKKDREILKTLLHCVSLRCPVCGESLILQRPFRIKHHCPVCRALFQREAGFFVGAIMINLVTTEVVILGVYIFWSLFVGSYEPSLFKVLLGVALLFPAVFYHHSWSIWLTFDHLLETLPKYEA